MSAGPKPAATPASYVMVAALVLIWGSTFLLVKIALVEAPPMIVALARAGLGALVVLPYTLLSGHGLPQGASRWVASGLVGVFSLTIPLTLLCWAQLTVPSGVAGIYMAAIPLFILPLAHLFSPGESMTLHKLAGFAIGFVGVVLLIGPEAVRQLGSASVMAQLACLGASLSYACGSIAIRRSPKMDPIAMAAGSLIVGSLLLIPFCLSQWPQETFSVSVWGILIWIGAVATGLSMVLRVKVISTAGSVFMSVAGYFVPVTALVIGAVFAGEVIEPLDAVACLLILCGVAFAQFTSVRTQTK